MSDNGALKDIHRTGTHVPEKDFSPPAKEAKADASDDGKGSMAKAESLPTENNHPDSTPAGGKTAKPVVGARTPAREAHGFGHPASAKQGPLRCSGHSGAHQIGKRRK